MMSQLVLDRNARLLLQAKAHHLDPVVLLGGNGLTEAVIKEPTAVSGSNAVSCGRCCAPSRTIRTVR